MGICTRTTASLLAWTAFAAPLAAADGGLSPEEARARMVVPEGFRVEVFASEPDVRQPVAACFDDRGRMWVIEYLQYPNPAGLVPVKVDQYLRTQYDRIPEPPPKGPRGADRIKILEDSNGDGKVDKVTTFAEGLNLASGLAVGHGGVFVGQAPYLLFYADKDRDDRPDGDPEVVVSGFGMQDAHATLNSLTWGPDGWLYGAQGSTVTAKIQGLEFQQGIWRYHPKTRNFELFAEGGGNTWGVDFDRLGNLFGSSNGGFVAFHMVRGGNYWKGFAKHGPLHNPRSYGYFDSIPISGPKPGGHVTPGGIIYKGEQFPAEFRGAFLGANLLSNAVYWYKLASKGSTFTMTPGGTLLDARDPWFRPIDLLTGPDGSVFVVDWYDKRASHLDPRDTWDKTNGRIYKLSFGAPRRVEPFDLARKSTPELIDLLKVPNDWWSDAALRILHERRDLAEADVLRDLVEVEKKDEARALRLLFAYLACDDPDWTVADRLLRHPLAGVRRWTSRWLGDHEDVAQASVRPIVVAPPGVEGVPVNHLSLYAYGEHDIGARAELSASAARWPTSVAAQVLFNLAMHDHITGDPHLEPPEQVVLPGHAVTDPHLPLRMWWAVEAHLRREPATIVGAMNTPLPGGRPAVLRLELLPRMARALAEDGGTDQLDLCAALLDAADSAEDRERILVGMTRGLRGGPARVSTPKLAASLAKVSRESPKSLAFLRTAVHLGSEAAYKATVERLGESAAPTPERLEMIELLGEFPRPSGRAALLDEMAKDHDDATTAAVFAALARDAGDEVADRIVARYPLLAASAKVRAVEALLARKEWAERLVAAIGPKGVPVADVKPAQAARVAGFGDADLTARLEQAWGRLPNHSSEAKVRRAAEIRGVLPEGDKGDAARGKIVFQAQCAACHRLFGEGERIGPELTGAERGDLDFLLASLVDPSAVIRKEYEGQTIALRDGRVLSGLVVEEDARSLILFDAQKQRTIVSKDGIEERKSADASVMPDGLLNAMTEDQIRDLFRYLQSSGTSP